MRFPRLLVARPRLTGSLAVLTLVTVYAVGLGIATRPIETLPPDTSEYADIARSLIRGTGYTINMVYMHAGLRDGPIRHVPELHGLLQPFLVAPVFAVFGVHAALVKVPTLVFAALSVVLVFEAGRRLFGAFAGAVAASVLLGHQWTALLAIGGSDDVGHALFAVAGLLAFERFLKGGDRRLCWAAGGLIGLSALEKYSGIVVPGVVVVAWLLERERRKIALREWAFLVVPVLLSYALYALRNVASHGKLAFSFTAVDWLAKTDVRLYFGYYPVPPSTLEVLRELGPLRVLGLVFQQVKLLAIVVYGNPLVYAGGPVALYFCRSQPVFRRIAALYALCMLAIVCVAYHVEIRYLFGLELAFAIAIGGALSRLCRRWLDHPSLGEVRELQAALAVLVFAAVATVRASDHLLSSFQPPDHRKLCARSVDYLRQVTRDDTPILTTNPWFVSWVLDRPAVGVPTNGAGSIVTVARHYRTRWALSGADASFLNAYADALDPASALRPHVALQEAHCGVHRLMAIR